jgi:hypothetical protein
MNLKKLASAALTATTVLWMVGAAALPLANAQTSTSTLASTIASLQAQIASLTAELNSSGTTTTSVGTTNSVGATNYNFTSDLTVGSTGSAVTALQTFLIGQGDLVLATPTQYFGSMTQKALAKFQAAHNITPSVGYFGPKTRAYVNSLSTSSSTTTTTTITLPAGCTTTTGYSTTTGASCATTTTTLPTGCTSSTGFSPVSGASCASGVAGVTVATGAAMSIGLDAQTPGSANVAAGAVNTPVLKLNFTAGATPVTVTNLVLTRTGLSQDSDLDNVYLYSGATKLASNLGFNNGAITFSNGAGLFTVPANSTMVVTVTVDVAPGTSSSGHIFQIGLASAANVTGGTFSGNFPLTSAQFTIANVSNLATLTVSGFSSSTVNVNSGQLDDLVGQMTVQAGNNPVKVTSVNLTNVGSVQPNYIQNIKLMDGSTQLGATITSLGSNNIATFDLSGAPLMLTSGQSVVLSLYADITGGVGRQFQFSIQQASDVQAQDTTYGVGIGATVGSGFGNFPIDLSYMSIQQGNLVISKDANTPQTYAVAGNNNQPLGVFDVLASGDSIKFNELDLVLTGGNAVNNLRVVDDQGAQIGSTVNVLAGTSLIPEGSGSLNYIIPANTTRVLTVYGDLPATSTNSIAVGIGGGKTSAQSYTTYVSLGTIATVMGNSLNVLPSGSNLMVTQDYSVGSPVPAAAGASNVEIGSYTFTAGQINSVNLTGFNLTVAAGAAPYLTNLKVMDGTTPFGNVYSTVSPAPTTYNFNGTSIVIPATQSVTLGVYANISGGITTSSTVQNATVLQSVSATTNVGNAVTASSTNGQWIYFNPGGQLTATLGPSTPQASYLGMNIPNVEVAQYQFSADNNSNETLTALNITDSASATTSIAAADHSTFINYQLTNTAGTPLTSVVNSSNGQLTFTLNNGGLPIAANNLVDVNLIASVNSYPNASSSATHAFALNTYQYTNGSGSTTTVPAATTIGKLFTVYQASLGITAGTFAVPASISGAGTPVGAFNFSVGNTSKNVTLTQLTMFANGSLVNSSTVQHLQLYDGNTALSTATATGTTAFSFNLATSTYNEVIGQNGSLNLTVKEVNSPGGLTSFSNGGSGTYQLVLTGVNWNDGVVNVGNFSPSLGTQIAGQVISASN